MACQDCEHTRLLEVRAKCHDSTYLLLDGDVYMGYVPEGLNIGDLDYIDFEVCADCGQMMGTWPLRMHQLEIARKAELAEERREREKFREDFGDFPEGPAPAKSTSPMNKFKPGQAYKPTGKSVQMRSVPVSGARSVKVIRP